MLAVSENRATLYRLMIPGHLCPYGLKARDLLRRRGHEVDDRWLSTREKQDALEAEHDVPTTPQVFLGRTRIGEHDDLRRFSGQHVRDLEATRHTPVPAVFAAMAALAMLKLQDLECF